MAVIVNKPEPVYEGRLLDLIETVEHATLVYSPHPLLAGAGRRVLCAPFAPGESIARYLDRVGVRLGNQPVVLMLNDQAVPREEWALTVPKTGNLITIRALMRDGGGSDVRRVVLFIAVAVAAAYTGGAVGAAYGTVAGNLASAAVMIGGTLLINALLPPPRPALSDVNGRGDASPTYSLAGGSNRARRYEPLPLVFGKHRIFPDLGAQPYTEFAGDDQYLYQVFHFGLADMELSDLRIGNTPIERFDGVTVEVSGDDGALSLFPGNVDTQAGGALTSAIGWVTRNSSPDAVQLAIEITGNLFYTGDAGLQARSATIAMEYRAVGAASWETFHQATEVTGYHTHYWSAGHYVDYGRGVPQLTWIQVQYGSTDAGEHSAGEAYDEINTWRYVSYTELFGANLSGPIPPGSKAPPREIYGTVASPTITSNSRKPLRLTYTRQVPRGQYEVRVQRVTADETDARAVSDLVWSQLRTYQPDDADYAGQLRVALRIKASGQLQGVVDQFSAVASAREPVFEEEGVRIVTSGTAQAGADAALTLATSASPVDDVYNTMIARLADGRENTIADYDGATKVATMAGNWPAAWLWLPGTAGNHASTPDSAAISISGDQEIRIRCAAVDWSTSQQYLCGRYASASNAGLSLRIDAGGVPALDWVDGASSYHTVSATAAVGFTDGVANSLRAVLDVDNGAGGHAVRFETALDGVSWTPLGSTVTNAGVTSVMDTSLPLVLGNYAATGGAPFEGEIYAMELRDGIGGPIVAAFDPLAAEIGDATLVSSTGETWTIATSGSPTAALAGAPDSASTYEIVVPEWPVLETSNPAWHILELARGKRINGRRAYGAGLPDARIDIENLKDFAAWCDAQGLTFNGVFDRAESVKEMMDTIARTGRGSTSWATGKLGVVWDAPNLPVSAVFGMANIRRNSFEVHYVTERLADEIVVSFVNPDLDWQQDSVRALVPGVSEPSTEARVELFGCTDKDMAGRDANLLAAQQAYRRRMISWETDMEGLVVSRGDVVSLSHDLTQWGYSGRLVAGSSTQLTLDRQVPFSVDADHYVGIVFPNGYYTVLDVTYQAGPANVIDLDNALPVVDDAGNTLYAPDADPDHPPMDYKWLFAPSPTPGKRVKIFSVQPLSEHHARLTAFDDEDAFYLNENAGYIYLSPSPAASAVPALQNVTLSETLLRVGSGWAVRLTITWDATGDYASARIRAGIDGAPLEEAGGTFGRRFELTLPASGTVSLELTAFDRKGRYSDAGRYETDYTIAGKDAPPPDVTAFTIQGNRLAWAEVDVPDLAGYVIRFQYGARRSFDDAQPLHEGVLTESPYDMLIRPEGAVTLMIKALDTSGNYSAGAAVIVTDLGDALVANIVQTVDLQAAAWPGTITNGTIDGSDHIVADETTLFYNAADAASFYGPDLTDFYPAASYAQLTYETEEIALTEATTGSVLSLPYSIAGPATQILWRRVGPDPFYAEVDSAVFYDAADGEAFYDAAPAYAPWVGPVLPLREVVQWKVIVAQGGEQAVISALTPTLDMPDIIERINDFTVGSAGARLPLTKTFRAIRNVSLTLQDDGGSATTAKVFDKDTAAGPLVQCFDGAVPAAGLVDATIQGY